MKKLIFLTLVFALLMSTAAFASQIRVLTMGDNHVVLTDDANIWNWPSRLNNYPNLAVAEFQDPTSSNNMYQFGVHWAFGDDQPWVLATYFEDNSTFQPYFGYPFTPTSSNRRGHFFYAKAMGTNKFGARLSYYQSGFEETDNGPSQEKESSHYIEASFGLTAADDSWDIAVTGGFGSWEDTEDDTAITEPDGLVDFSAVGRMFWESGPNYRYVPHAGFEYHKAGANFFTGDSVDFTQDLTNMTIELGIGQVYTPSNNVEAVLDAGIYISRDKNEVIDADSSNVVSFEDKNNFTAIPYFKLGLDAEVLSWLDVRFGATSYWARDKFERTQGTFLSEDKANFADNETFFGLGFHWGNLHVDTYTDPRIFLEGLTFISGTTNRDMNFAISAVYDLM
jgi:hypothetical protein